MLKKQFKTTACIIISLITLLFTAVSYAKPTTNDSLVSFVTGMDIMNGYPDGDFGLNRNVTRGEFAKIAVAASKYKNSVGSSVTVSPFADVPYYHWAAPYVRVATVNGFISGYVDATFKPDNYVLCEEAVTVALKLLGYSNEDFGASWPYGQMGLAANLDLTVGIDASIGQNMTRRDVAQLMYNLMNAQVKNTNSKYVSELGYSYAEGVVLISATEEDGTTKISTNVGSLSFYKEFDMSLLGQKGDVIIKNGDTLASFVPYGQSAEKYVVYSKVDSAIVAYKNGNLSQISLNDSDTAYYNSAKTTYGAVKSNISMGDTVYVKKNSLGQVEYINIAKNNFEGPYTVRSNQWYTAFENIDGATIMRDGIKVNKDGIKNYDVVYYSKDLNMVFAYTKKITGVYQNALPNSDNPESIVVSGVTYNLESAHAFNAVSSTGKFRLGDTITLLIGRNGDVADVIDGDYSYEAVAGYLIESGTKDFIDSNGNTYVSNYITVVTADGNENEYTTSQSYEKKVGNVVRVAFKDGKANITTVTKSDNIYGVASYSEGKIGNTKVSDNIKILDVALSETGNVGSWASIFMQRIDGIDIDDDDVLYYEKNSVGEISSIILDNVTGDAYKYGIVTDAQTTAREFSYSGRYVVDIGGKSYSHSISGIYSGISKGYPVKVIMKNGAVSNISTLNMLRNSIDSISTSCIVADDVEYKISPDVVVYKQNYNYQYLVTHITEALQYPKGKIRVFFDKSPSNSGQVRVIVLD